MVIGLVGTTIAPWMQFYLQASVVEKGITPRQYRAARWDVILGCIFTDVVAWFIIVACAATLHAAGRTNIQTAADAAQALRPLAGEYAYLLFAAGLFNASLFAARPEFQNSSLPDCPSGRLLNSLFIADAIAF